MENKKEQVLVPLDEVMDEIKQMQLASNIRDNDRPEGHGSILIRAMELCGRLHRRFKDRIPEPIPDPKVEELAKLGKEEELREYLKELVKRNK